jgi:hypothetical protein
MESDTSTSSVRCARPKRCFRTVRRTYVSIASVVRPSVRPAVWLRASSRPESCTIGVSSFRVDNSRPARARSSDSSLTSTRQRRLPRVSRQSDQGVVPVPFPPQNPSFAGKPWSEQEGSVPSTPSRFPRQVGTAQRAPPPPFGDNRVSCRSMAAVFRSVALPAAESHSRDGDTQKSLPLLHYAGINETRVVLRSWESSVVGAT